MENNELDQLFRDKLYNYSSNVPDSVWERIQAKRERKKPFLFWKNRYFHFIVLSLLATSILSSLYLNNTGTKTNVENVIKPEAESSILSASKHTEKLQVSELVVAPVKTTFTARSSNNYSTIEVNNKITKSIARVENPNLGIALKNSIIHKSIEVNQPEKQINKPLILDDDNLKDISIISPLLDSSQVNLLTPATSYIPHNYPLSSIVVQNKLVSIVPFSKKSTLAYPSSLVKIRVPNFKTSKWSLDLMLSLDVNQRKLYLSNDVSKLIVNAKDSSLTLRQGFTMGARLTKKLNSNWLFKTGIEYKQVNERFRYAMQGEVKDIQVLTTRTYVGDAGQTLSSTDTTTYKQTGNILHTSYNAYKSLEVPLEVGYEFKAGKWNFSINSGFITTLFTNYEGQTFNNLGSPVELSAQKSNGFFKSKVAFSMFNSINILYGFKKNRGIFIEPYFRNSLTSNSVSQIGYNQNFNSYGIFMGLRYNLYFSGIKR